jgi:predicted Rossmann fold flavoprotein
MRIDVIVLGAGAAGLMCAMEAAKRGRTVAVLERAEKIGKKILISGGGRCNFTNIHCTPANFLSENPHFCKSALARYTPRDFIALVERHGIPYHEKTLGQLFCDRSARDIVNMLHEEYDRVGVEVFLNCDVGAIEKHDLFRVETNLAEFEAPSLVVATGGPSIPKIGATSYGYRIAKKFGLRVVQPYPALVPLTLENSYTDLSGVSTEVIASTDGAQFREKMLFTHRGLSGPAILQISSYWKPGAPITLDLLPGIDISPNSNNATGRLRSWWPPPISLSAWPTASSTAIRSRSLITLTPNSQKSRPGYTPGPSHPTAPKTLKRPRSPAAA